MPKKNPKKAPKKSTAKKRPIKKGQERKKLGAGKKQCKSCGVVMPIHRKVCTECGHVHEMRKNKEHIMKKINKMTPVLVKSLIENNDFNQFRGWGEDQLFQVGVLVGNIEESNGKKVEEKKLKGMTRRRSQNPKPQPEQPSPKNTFTPTNNQQFQYRKFDRPISCIASSKNWVIFAQAISKTPIGLEEKDQLTIEAFRLQNFSLVGLTYSGSTLLHIGSGPDSNEFSKIMVNKCVTDMKVFANLVALLTGESTLILFSLPQVRKGSGVNSYNLGSYLEIIEPSPDRITSFQFLRSTLKNSQADQSSQSPSPEIHLAVGTLFGRISVYKITNEGYTIVKFIPNAHLQMVTTIAECSLNDGEEIMFASGSYDGAVSVWDLWEKDPVFSFECSNRKIWSIHWDPGAKFLFINRDEMTDTCVIICFYSINKIEESVHLANTIETRTVKTRLNATMVHHDYYSKSLPVLDPVNGILKILEVEELRGSSLKKKKPKKDEGIDKYYKINFKEDFTVEVEEMNDGDEQLEECLSGSKIAKGDTKKFPIFSGLSIQSKEDAQYIYISSYNGMVVVHRNLSKSQ